MKIENLTPKERHIGASVDQLHAIMTKSAFEKQKKAPETKFPKLNKTYKFRSIDICDF